MVDNFDVRVWVANPSSTNPSKDFKPKSRDIIIIYEDEFRGLSKIYAHSGSETNKYLHFFDHAITLDTLLAAFDGARFTERMTQEGYSHRLSSDEWQILRRLIIEANEVLTEIIEQMESEQEGLPVLIEEEAILFDAVRTALQIFGHPKTAAALASLDKMRSGLEDEKMGMLNMVTNMRESLIKNEIEGQPVSELSDREKRIMEGYRNNYNRTESYGIEQDFQNPDPDMEHVSGIPFDMNQNMIKLNDPETNRELTIFMAHRRGTNETDLAASDLIYINEIARFIVFVQYKRLSTSYTVQMPPSATRDRDQFVALLNVCRRQIDGCTNYIADTDDYIPEPELRLVDCPTLYKFISRDGDISPRSKGMPGSYMPACLLTHLIDEPSSNIRKAVLARAFPTSHFYGMMRRGHIGSRSTEFDTLYDVVEEHLGLVIAVETSIAPVP